ncbi:pectin lyase-like protein [Exidia glandulosa HHB12029]|uniref:galacturonan 1,4-alpha-galacturonidase n=1 Tax=Exidia glandulosa HHB12029 TaxID=1314781 RepID=A0A165DRJ5_EXIGL|nr:pectin lyase-like protein [Exidia glandulosa HHB12029]
MLTLLAITSALLSTGLAAGKTPSCTLKALGKGKDDSPRIAQAFKVTTRLQTSPYPSLTGSSQSCSNVVVPKGENLLIGTKLDTTGLDSVHIRLLGKFTLKPDVDYWRDNAFNVSYQDNSAAWMFGGKDVILDGEGTGTIDGNGQTFYDARVTNDSLRPPHFMLAYGADNLVIRNLKVRQSPRWTFLIHSSKNVLFHDLSIISRSNTWARGRESNRETDGVDIYNSSHVTLHNLSIDNGDDCVSFKPNATNIYVDSIFCNGTHGVSVGSLGEYDGPLTDVVENVYVNNVHIQNSENGPRIKTWGGAGRGYGYVNQIVFSNFWHTNNDSPITIDNCYKTAPTDCLAHPSNMTISNVYFNNQQGTASGKYGNIGVAMVCSVGKCTDVYLNNVNVTAPEACGPTVYANSHLNVQGNSAYKFSMDAPTYNAGGILTDNSTASGVTCSNGQVIVTEVASDA